MLKPQNNGMLQEKAAGISEHRLVRQQVFHFSVSGVFLDRPVTLFNPLTYVGRQVERVEDFSQKTKAGFGSGSGRS